MATRTVVAAGGNWDTAATWVEGAVPLAGDDVVINALSGNSTVDAAFAGTVASLNITAKAETSLLTLSRNLIISGALVVNATVLPIRQLITSNTLGTARTLSCGSVNLNMVDFRDITFAGVMTITAAVSVGDCGGNSGVNWSSIVTEAAAQTWVNVNGGNWSDVANWSGRVPLPQDDVSFACAFGASKSVESDMPRIGKNINWTGMSGINFRWQQTIVQNNTMYGSLILVPTVGSLFHYSQLIFEGRGSYILTTAGLSWIAGINVKMIGGSLTLQDAFVGITTSLMYITNGTFDAGAYSVNVGSVSIYGTSTVSGTGTWTINGASYYSWEVSVGATLNMSAATFLFTYTGASIQRFNGGGKVYGAVVFSAGGAGGVLIAGNNTFTNFTVNAPKTLTITSGSIQTFINAPVMVGSLGNLITINASGATAGNLAKASGIVSCDYLSLTKSAAGGGATWYAGANSQDVSGNSGWIFTAVPGYFPRPRLINGAPFGGGLL